MRTMSTRADDRGSIPIFMVVMVVVSALVVVTADTVDSGLRSTRRAGDSANALQVADAGVNDAIQQAPTIPLTTASFTRSGSLGSSGSYTYTATRDLIRRDVWHIDVLGTDKSGRRRRIRANGVPSSLFSTPLFVNSTLSLSSGVSLDSFSSGVNVSSMCTGKGVIATNEPTTMTFGNSGQGAGVNNCKKLLGLDPSWDFSMDGCTSYGDGSQALPPMGTGKCPPEPYTYKTPPKRFTPTAVVPPGTPGTNPTPADFLGTDQKLLCDPLLAESYDAATKTRYVKSLVGGKIYYYNSVTLRGGCGVTSPALIGAGGGVDLNKPVYVYATTRVDIGNPNGQGGLVNKPPAGDASVCGATASSSQLDGKANPAHYYCPRWSSTLRIRMVSSASATSVVNIRSSGTKFWGAIEVPTGSLTLSGSQIEVWGAAASNTADSSAQFTWHFDDALADISSGLLGLSTWREEALP